MYSQNDYRDYLEHHGILGQKWGKQNGPPYPLDASDHSASERKAGWKKSLGGGRNEGDWRSNIKRRERKNIVKTIKKEAGANNGMIYKDTANAINNLKSNSTIRSAAKELSSARDSYAQASRSFDKLVEGFDRDFANKRGIKFDENNDLDFHPDYWKEYDAWLKSDKKAAAAEKAAGDAYDNYKYTRSKLAADVLGKYANERFGTDGARSVASVAEWTIEAALTDLDEESKANRRSTD